MLQHRCQIEFDMTLQPFTVLASIVNKLFKTMDKDGVRWQFIVFANFCNKVEEFSTCLKAYVDLKGYTGDVITVVGTQYKEQKMHHAALFLKETPSQLCPMDNSVFDVIACLASCTMGCCQTPTWCQLQNQPLHHLWFAQIIRSVGWLPLVTGGFRSHQCRQRNGCQKISNPLYC
jgi:hypothetical protein